VKESFSITFCFSAAYRYCFPHVRLCTFFFLFPTKKTFSIANESSSFSPNLQLQDTFLDLKWRVCKTKICGDIAAYTYIHTCKRRIPFYDIMTALQLYVLEKYKHQTRNKWYQIIERVIILFPLISCPYPTICMWHIYDLNGCYISYICIYAKFE
jgi:hypothetical protein